MLTLRKVLTFSVFKKFVMSITGLAWVLFLITHLLANSLLYAPIADTYNLYSQKLLDLSWLLYIAEIGLVLTLLLHVVTALQLTCRNRSARNTRYAVDSTKGGPSKKNVSSTTMIISGSALLVFLVIHVWHMKYGPGMEAGYVATVRDIEVRDLHRLVVEIFHQPLWVAFYMAIMLLLGSHLRHGIWSAFQSAGVAGTRTSRVTYRIGMTLALVLALGFFFIPIWIYFDMPGRFV